MTKLDPMVPQVDWEAAALIPQSMAKRQRLLAVGFAGEELVVVCAGEADPIALEEVRQVTGRALRVQKAEEAAVDQALRTVYARLSAHRALRDMRLGASGGLEQPGRTEAPVVRLLESFLRQAAALRASDIHIEPYETQTLVRMRVDGVIGDYMKLPGEVHQTLIARVKILSGLDIAERRIPQDGHFRFDGEEGGIHIRVSLLPTVFGEKAVLRLLAASGQVEDHVERFGMNEAVYRRFAPLLSVPNGILYVTGPTGSGKSTTLYMILEHLSKGAVNIATIEDPVERNLFRVNQTQVGPNLSFEKGLRAILRQDPDIIMVGETRDAETAEISVRSAITGHMVLSTLHTNDAVSTILRLRDMGIEPYLIANSLMGVVAQRLLRKTCPHCGREMAAAGEELAFWGSPVVRRGQGCLHCGGTGYRGRIAIHELLVVDRTLRRMIAQGADLEAMEEHARGVQGMRTLQEQAADLVRLGVTTPEEAARVVS